MTLFDIIVPVAALAVAGAGVLIIRATDKPADRHRHAGK